MIIPPWREEAISRLHNRESFDCGETALNEFLQRHARRSHEQGGAKTFVAVDERDGTTILGFYSLSAASVNYRRTPAMVKRGLAPYDVPCFRLARLGVDSKFHGKGLGAQLLLKAGERCLRAAAEVGGVAMLIDAKNKRVAAWYARYGAIPLDDAPLALMLPLVLIEKALNAED